MTTKEILIKAKGLIEKPENWRQGDLATFDPEKMESVAPFCALGAMAKTCELLPRHYAGVCEKNHGNTKILAKYEEAENLLEACMNESVAAYNDSHDHECVVAAFDAAIERCSD